MAFRFTVVVRHNGHDIDRKEITLSSRKNLFAAIKREFSDFKFIIDRKYGVEVSEISGLKKSRKAGLHFTIDGEVPWVADTKTGLKLYLSLYHITVTPEMLAGKNIVLELVSASCDFANSVVDARLDFRAEKFNLEPLLDPNASPKYIAKRLLPVYSEQLWREDHLHFLFHLERLSRRMGGFQVRKPKELFPNVFQPKPDAAKPGQGILPLHETPAPIQTIPQVVQEFLAQPMLSGNVAPVLMPIQHPIPNETEPSAQAEEANPQTLQFDSTTKMSSGSIIPREIANEGTIQPHKQEVFFRLDNHRAPKTEVWWHNKTGAVQLSSLTSFKAVIFDLDGIVVDSEHAHLLTFNQVLRAYGIKIAPSFWKRNYTGIGSVAIMKDVVARYNLKAGVPTLVEKRSRVYGAYVKKHGLPEIRGFSEISKMLLENGVKIAVASGGHRPHIAASLRFLKMEGTRFVGLEDVRHAKPAPDTFLLAAETLGVKPSECIVFEDSLAGIEAARRAAMPCIALSTTLPARLLQGKAVAVFTNYKSRKLRRLLARLIAAKGGKRQARKLVKRGARIRQKKKARPRPSQPRSSRFGK